LRILLIERLKLGELSEPKFDGREIALTHTSVRRLRSLGAWDRVPATQIWPLKRARVFDGQSSFALSFDSWREGEALGMLVPNAAIRRAVFDVVREQRNCGVITNRAVTSLRAHEDFVEVLASGSMRLRARLAVAADTRFSPLRQSQGISAQMIDFGRSMLVCRMSHTTPHEGVATEWFGHGQTIAILPLQEGMSSYILTLPAREIDTLMEMPPASFARDAERRTQTRWGRMSLASTRHVYPLVAVYADCFVARRFALVGDAAVGMHPVTAHGYNFGLAGAVTLAREVLRAAGREGDIGGLDGLLRYERSHWRATWPLFTATNALAKLYTDERFLPRLARAVGLRLMQAVSPVRHAVEAQLSA
jgi:ubiquinone biosynthesis UbiH/UbiF/VisC/COQ6 family hydroxylase